MSVVCKCVQICDSATNCITLSPVCPVHDIDQPMIFT